MAHIPSPNVFLPRPIVGSPRKRRRFLRETEDASGVLSIEDYNYRSDVYHSSDMLTKYPLPMKIEEPDSELKGRLAYESHLEGQVAGLLQLHNIEFTCIEFCLMSKPDYPAEGDKSRPAVSIGVDIKDTISAAPLSVARRDISDMLAENGLGDLVVDIQDTARAYLPYIYPIRSTDQHTQLYRRVREDLLRVVRADITRLWVTLGLYNVGSSFVGSSPAVALVVDPLATHDWQMLRQKLIGIIEVHRPKNLALDVEIFPGYCGDLDPQRSPASDLRKKFTPAPKMGASIGVVGKEGAGTLGGFFTLKVGETVHEGFLTSSHVVTPPDNPPQEVRDQFSKHGVGWDTLEDHVTKTKVQYLARKDNIKTMESCYNESRALTGFTDANGNWHEGEIQGYEKKAQWSRLGGKDSTPWVERLALAKTAAQDVWDKYLCLEKMPQILGSTVFTSGRAAVITNQKQKKKKKKIMDWAFVSCAGTSPSVKNICSAFGNLLPSPAQMGIGGCNPERYSADAPRYLPRKDLLPRREFGSIEPDRWYFKVGRTTGLTAGICNGVETYVNLKEVTRYAAHDRQGGEVVDIRNPDPETEEDPESYTEEWFIINAHSDHRRWAHQHRFCANGDSGSLIIDIDGRICGLLFGNLSGWQAPRVSVQEASDPNAPPSNTFQQPGHADRIGRGEYIEAGIVSDIGYVMADIAARASGWHDGLEAVVELP
ncbi:MAG: hypothetical protein Q9207_007694 [Kuettlingeria erythrocarpa]